MASGIKNKVAIIGMGCTRFGELWGRGPSDLVVEAVPVVGKAVASLEFNRERLEEVLDDPAIHATERAVKMALEDGVPYREAYFMVKEQLFGHT